MRYRRLTLCIFNFDGHRAHLIEGIFFLSVLCALDPLSKLKVSPPIETEHTRTVMGKAKESAAIMDKKEVKMTNNNKNDWFTIEKIDENTSIISEYKHWEETHCYVLNGTDKCLLIDTGLGVENILEQVQRLTDKPVTVVTTHVHYDHFGGHKYFPDFYVHEAETEWINGGFPLTIEQVRNFLTEEPCDFPKDFDVNDYNLFKGVPTRVLKDNDTIELGERTIQVLHTPGHSPGHMCFYEKAKGYLYTGDLIYMDVLFADFPSTDPIAYMKSIKKLLPLTVKKILPAHHDLNVPLSIIKDMDKAFSELYEKGKLKHGSGTFTYENFGIRL